MQQTSVNLAVTVTPSIEIVLLNIESCYQMLEYCECSSLLENYGRYHCYRFFSASLLDYDVITKIDSCLSVLFFVKLFSTLWI